MRAARLRKAREAKQGGATSGGRGGRGAAAASAPGAPVAGGVLRARFIEPPFSVLDAKQGPWQKRKRMKLTMRPVTARKGPGTGAGQHPAVAHSHLLAQASRRCIRPLEESHVRSERLG